MTSTIVRIPVTIAANELLTSVGFLHSGTLKICKKKQWKICYCIVSQGCLYLYDDWLSHKTFLKQSLIEFESAWESNEEHHGQIFICFYLCYHDNRQPLHFCCDTEKSQKEWVEVIGRTIYEVRCKFNPSADSGFGSAGNVPPSDTKMRNVEKGYDEVDKGRVDAHQEGLNELADIQMKEQHVLDTSYTDDDYEDVNCPLKGTTHAGQSLGKRNDSVASSFCFVSSERNPICSNEPAQVAHENDSTRKTINFDDNGGGSQIVSGESGSFREKTIIQNVAIGHQEIFNKLQDELKARVENKGLSLGGPKRDAQSK